jgi:SAM-dependent methyltransferase
LQTRNSNGLDQFSAALAERPGLSILDLAGANQNTISFVTNFGHRLYSNDLLVQLDHSFGPAGATQTQADAAEFYDRQTDAGRVAEFLESTLDFADDSFDGVLVWDTLQYLAPSLLATVVDRLHRMLRPGAILLALFYAEERPGLVPGFSYRISDHRTILMSPRDERRPAQFFNNRNLEKLFQDFNSVKFFLTRDSLREVIVRR